MPAPARSTAWGGTVPGRVAQKWAARIWIFSSPLGFMALVEQEAEQQEAGRTGIAQHRIIVRQLTIAHASPSDALRAVEPGWRFHATVQDEPNSLVERLQAYAEGADVEFDDVELALDSGSLFRRRVLAACRAIPRGQTRTYGELALAAGAPRAARAVGTAMASNRVAIIVPCHRVVRSGGQLGGYSAPTGRTLKRRLLELENAGVSNLVLTPSRSIASCIPQGR